ncbi:hypothetical protein V8J82_10685 [Gymnodinialimonas sp. 2305UL16-5]|uniref:hypothetical protein n=1 Tax=Gymnodinialimonas mytili TaxID=3126503 RepID=UPI0030B66A35
MIRALPLILLLAGPAAAQSDQDRALDNLLTHNKHADLSEAENIAQALAWIDCLAEDDLATLAQAQSASEVSVVLAFVPVETAMCTIQRGQAE